MNGSLDNCQFSLNEQTCESVSPNPLTIRQSVQELQHEVTLLKEMTNLLISYEKECIDKLDLKGAKETRNRITLLTQKEQQLKQKIIEVAQERQVMEISQEQESLINCFDKCWSDYLNDLVADLAGCEQKLKDDQKKKREDINCKFDYERNNGFKPTTKLSDLKRKVFGLMKLHNYEQAEFESQKAKKLEEQQRRLWEERVEQRRKNALQLFAKKASKQFQVLRSKNEDILFKKMNERDTKFSILLKKHQVKRVEATRSTKQLMRSISSTSLNTKRFQ